MKADKKEQQSVEEKQEEWVIAKARLSPTAPGQTIKTGSERSSGVNEWDERSRLDFNNQLMGPDKEVFWSKNWEKLRDINKEIEWQRDSKSRRGQGTEKLE